MTGPRGYEVNIISSCLLPSLANDEEQLRYMNGDCHILAIALHRKLGWRMQAQLDQADPFWQDENDPDNFIPNVLHVYALDQMGRAWDVMGCRPESIIFLEIQDMFSPQDPSSDEMRSESELKMYVGCWAGANDEQDGNPEGIERPLGEYDDQDIEQAWQMATRIFAGMEGFSDPGVDFQPTRRITIR